MRLRMRDRRSFQKRTLRVATIDHDSDLFSRLFEQRHDPFDQSGRQLKFRRKPPATIFRDRRHRLSANIQHGPQWQSHRASQGVTQSQRQRDPDVAVQELLVGRSRCRIVMDVGSFDMRPVAFGRRIVDDQQHAWGQRQSLQKQKYQPRSHRFGLASEGCQEVIIVLVVETDSFECSQDVSFLVDLHSSVFGGDAGIGVGQLVR